MSTMSSPNAIYNALSENQVDLAQSQNRNADMLTLGFGIVTKITLAYTYYEISYTDNKQMSDTATLVFEADFYIKVGFPQLGDRVVLQHSNYKNPRIFFIANPKIEEDPPYRGQASLMAQSVPSSLANG
jgi:hypothetical protein